MSVQALGWVLQHSKAQLTERLVLIAIANHLGDTGWAWPRIDTIAREAQVSDRTVYRCLDALEAAGELTIRRRAGRKRNNLYGITALIQPDSLSGSDEEVPDRLSGSEPDKLAGEPGGLSGSTCHPWQEVPDTGVTRIIKNHQEPSGVRARAATDTSPIGGGGPSHGAAPGAVRLPPQLPDDTRARGADWVRALRGAAASATAVEDECRVCGAPCPPGHGRCVPCSTAGREVPWRTNGSHPDAPDEPWEEF